MAIKTITVNGTSYAIDYEGLENRPVSLGTVTLGTAWTGGGPYSQSVTVTGATDKTKVDLQPDATTLAQMASDGTTAIWVENDGGTLTAKAMGAAPTVALTVQCTLTEVV